MNISGIELASQQDIYRLSCDRFTTMQQQHPDVAAAFQSAVIHVLGNRLIHAYNKIIDIMDT